MEVRGLLQTSNAVTTHTHMHAKHTPRRIRFFVLIFLAPNHLLYFNQCLAKKSEEILNCELVFSGRWVCSHRVCSSHSQHVDDVPTQAVGLS